MKPWLYGMRGSERMFSSVEEVWRHDIEPYGPLGGERYVIEVWSSVDPIKHIPTTGQIIEYMVETAADDQGLDGSADAWDQAALFARRSLSEFVGNARAALSQQVNYRQCDEKIHEVAVTVGRVDGLPYFDDGVPVLRSANV